MKLGAPAPFRFERAVEHVLDLPGALTGSHRCAVERRKQGGVLGHGHGQALALHHARANGTELAALLARIGLFDQHAQHLFQRQSGLEERGELAQDQRALAGMALE